MKAKVFIGWTILLVLSFLPIVPWLFGPALSYEFTYANITHAIGQVSGLVGMTMFSLTLVLAMRLGFIEELFDGLDKVYKVHSFLGATSLVLLLMHPLFLVLKYIPSNVSQAASYLSLGHSLIVDAGIIALSGMIILIFISFYTKIKYNYWKISHKFLGALFLLASVHIIFIREFISRDYIFSGYYIYAITISLIGIFAYAYALFFKNRMRRAVYKVDSINTNGVYHDITLAPTKKTTNYKSGQFFFLAFKNNALPKEAHPFSIASNPSDQKLRFIIKNLGDYTSKLTSVKKGDKVIVHGPFGRFYDTKSADQIWIAGGIGITPFIGMAEDLVVSKKKAELYYTAKTEEDLINHQRFKQIASSNKNFTYHPWITATQGRLTPEIIIQNTKSINNKSFFLCGPEEFKNSIITALLKKRVKKNKIHSEEFNFK